MPGSSHFKVYPEVHEWLEKKQRRKYRMLIHMSHVRVHSSYILYVDTVRQRVLNELWKAKLSSFLAGLMIWLHHHPLPLLPSVSSTSDPQKDLKERPVAYGRGG
jgi:hypothetical protein